MLTWCSFILGKGVTKTKCLHTHTHTCMLGLRRVCRNLCMSHREMWVVRRCRTHAFCLFSQPGIMWAEWLTTLSHFPSLTHTHTRTHTLRLDSLNFTKFISSQWIFSFLVESITKIVFKISRITFNKSCLYKLKKRSLVLRMV